jgi:prepilin-type N-terminal cleavage/methylation domain-containing protein
MRSFKKLKSNLDSGFTLIELLVVIIIIGILAGIAVIGVSGAQDAASKRACQANETQIAKGLRAYYTVNLKFPKVGGDISGTVHTFSKADLDLLTSSGTKFLETLPEEVDSAKNTKYYITAATDGNDSLTVSSVKKGTSDVYCAAVTG